VKLSSFELRALKAAQQSLTSPPSPVRFLKRSWKTYAWQIALLGCGAAYYWWGGWHGLSFILQGFVLGAIWREVVWWGFHRRLWPLNREITDWQRVSELITENESGAV
jgi:hypothetical protein